MSNHKKDKPLVSVVMSVYNTERYLAQAIKSILSQTIENFEFIIVNNGSTDKTSQIIYKFQKNDKRIKLIKNKKKLQIGTSLNNAIDQAKSDIIARMDPDDIAFPNRLQVQYTFLQHHSNVAIVGNDIILIDEYGKVIGKRTYPISSKGLKKILFRYSAFAHPTVMFRKQLFKKVGGYNPNKHPCEDIDLWFRLGKDYTFASIPIFLLKYRVLINSSSHQNLTHTEFLGLKIKIEAIRKYGYRPALYDIIYIILQFVTLWFMPFAARIRLYNSLRGKNLI